ncbi:uncharacterized protein C7orf50 homolog isoform X2 [Ailuropoda melanoleuca]|uniref:uncharacterized protein C7orf50 homolog isoform X2 n=1 Tax=Ailuropoda melanoleuca TaxID=9646 RepID=UPI001494AA7A|nr:uncharacterized protein C7orf50 homolog isoform X2 [Ailuropoda melanoleuca]
MRSAPGPALVPPQPGTALCPPTAGWTSVSAVPGASLGSGGVKALLPQGSSASGHPRPGKEAGHRTGRSSVGGQAGDGPPAARADPGGEEGPGEEAEEAAEERAVEAAAGVRSSPDPAGQVLWGPAGPGLPPWVPDELFSTLLAYLEGLRGCAREVTVRKAEALMRELDEASGTDPLPPGKTQRIRQVLQLLS